MIWDDARNCTRTYLPDIEIHIVALGVLAVAAKRAAHNHVPHVAGRRPAVECLFNVCGRLLLISELFQRGRGEAEDLGEELFRLHLVDFHDGDDGRLYSKTRQREGVQRK